MQRQTSTAARNPARRGGAAFSSRRGGAVIVVVLTLLTSLMFLGIFFYSLSDAELNVSRTFAQAPDQVINPDAVIDEALTQVIVGPPPNREQSALSGGQATGGTTLQVSDKSLLTHIIGLVTSEGVPADVRPRNGRGIGVFGTGTNVTTGLPQADSDAELGFDFNGDGVLDAAINSTNYRINLSSMANGGPPNFATPFERVGSEYDSARPDVDYTYPDINCLPLAYDATITSGANTFRVLIPSYFRPQLFPDRRDGSTVSFSTLYTDAQTAPQVLRPHFEHMNVDGTTRRYLSAATGTQAQSGDRNRLIAPFPFNVDINGGTANEMGVFSTRTPNPNTPYELDADADGDGVLDSIWLDLDHSIIDLADGRQAVPMFYVKIIDADALLNVNYHGNDPLITALSNSGTVDPFTHIHQLTGGWVHASNLGMSVSEINPLYALRAIPDASDPNVAQFIDPANIDAATRQHQGWMNDAGTGTASTFTRVQMANTEFERMLRGAPEYLFDLSDYANPNPASDIAGRYGEVAALRGALDGSTGIFPSAGDTTTDDDRDDGNLTNDGVGPDDNIATGVAHQDDFGGLLAPPLTVPPSVHPLDFSGLGNYLSMPAYSLPYGTTYRGIPSTGGVRDLGHNTTSALNPSRWLIYATQTAPLTYQPSLWSSQDNGTFPVFGISPWTQAATPGNLQVSQLPVGTAYDGLWNEPDEMVTDGNFPTAVDAPFPTSEMLALHPSDQQWQLVRENSRLRKLLPFNFEANLQAASIRQTFTTDSRDRVEHGHTRPANANRQWEFNDSLNGPNSLRFPPMFAGTASRHEQTPPSIDVNDPFRPVLRRLLTIEENNTANLGGGRLLPGQKLNINRLLVNFDRNGNPVYRHLTPHPIFQIGDESNPAYNPLYLRDGTPQGIRPVDHAHPAYTIAYYDEGAPLVELDPDIPANGTYPAVPFAAVSSDPFAAEAWARYDRQRLARDIYTLLYVVGAPDVDSLGAPFDPTTTAYTGPDVNANGIVDTLEAMAQFAVNYVDALDADDCITRFEFDTDLSDGWTNPPATAATVFGVETQQLAFSEVSLIQQAPANPDNNGTLHNENDGTNNEHRWLYIELRNASPFLVTLPTGSYRIARYLENETQRTGVAPIEAVTRFTSNGGGAFKQIGPGENFIVACHDGTVVNPAGPATSDFFANIDDMSPGFESIIPNSATAVPNPSDDPVMAVGAPHADLDLFVVDTMALGHEGYHETINNVGGTMLVDPLLNGDGTIPEQFQLRLERRLNTNSFEFGENDATWVEVDRFEVEGRTFFPSGENSTDIITALETVVSQERRQPLDEDTQDYTDFAVPEIRKHTIDSNSGGAPATKHQGNSRWASTNGGDRTTGFTLWQPHFNRDFSSVYELLSIPVVGPDRLIQDISDPIDPNFNRLSGWADSSAAATVPFRAFAAAGIFMHPDGQTDASVNTLDDNRWYRLFEFLEYPPRTQETVRDGIAVRRRTDGRLQLNTLRHEDVYAGLIDDDVQLITPWESAARSTADQHDAGRIWFDQLLQARDGIDPISSLPLPGVPGSMPFRSQSYIDPQPNTTAGAPDAQLQNTIMRRHFPTGGPSDVLSLLEARGTADVGNDTDPTNDPNNVDFHTRNRLLAKIANNSTNRSHVFAMWVGYELFEAHQPNPANPDIVQIGARIEDLPGHREFVVVDMTRLEEAFIDDPGDAQPGRFDFRKFIIYRKRIK